MCFCKTDGPWAHSTLKSLSLVDFFIPAILEDHGSTLQNTKLCPFGFFFLLWLIQLLVCNVFNGSSRVGKISKVVVNMENTAHQRWAQVLCRGLDERSLEERFEVLVTELMDASGLGETLVTVEMMLRQLTHILILDMTTKAVM